jgi:hypothetical protein
MSESASLTESTESLDIWLWSPNILSCLIRGPDSNEHLVTLCITEMQSPAMGPMGPIGPMGHSPKPRTNSAKHHSSYLGREETAFQKQCSISMVNLVLAEPTSRRVLSLPCLILFNHITVMEHVNYFKTRI